MCPRPGQDTDLDHSSIYWIIGADSDPNGWTNGYCIHPFTDGNGSHDPHPWLDYFGAGAAEWPWAGCAMAAGFLTALAFVSPGESVELPPWQAWRRPGARGRSESTLSRAPFRFCLNCGVAYGVRQRDDFGKLGSLGTEGRSSAITVLGVHAVQRLLADVCPIPKGSLSRMGLLPV